METISNPSLLEANTRILKVNITKLGTFRFTNNESKARWLHDWELELDQKNQDVKNLCEAVHHLRHTSIPVAFPTETVYGLGADATSSEAVKGIYKAKQRPSDNPLIVHICSLAQLRRLINPSGVNNEPIPAIYKPLIKKFWPGPLTILLPVPEDSALAPEVTAGSKTFGARMPDAMLALALIKLADRPLAAPSANASTRPSPTTAEHVKHDLNGRINIILDGGPCNIGVESTVVDGLSSPPAILRPGGVSIEQIRECEGWSDIIVGYKDSAQKESAPRAPGMKYKHYSPKAKVVLVEAGDDCLREELVKDQVRLGARKIGILRTRNWKSFSGDYPTLTESTNGLLTNGHAPHSSSADLKCTYHVQCINIEEGRSSNGDTNPFVTIVELSIGTDIAAIARNLFSALRMLDLKDVETIFVEGIDENVGGGAAAAVMNRLRKAAEVQL
jgi:L-threonylcarbamoyladenylate synthase